MKQRTLAILTICCITISGFALWSFTQAGRFAHQVYREQDALYQAIFEMNDLGDGVKISKNIIKDKFPRLYELGYYKIENVSGVILFWRFERFLGKGLLGVAYSPDYEPNQLRGWINFDALLFESFYLFSG